jgi:hypothetical protein
MRTPMIAALLSLVLALAVSTSALASSGDLTAGASTIVPASLNAGTVDAFGQPYEVKSRVTAVMFHNGTLPSSDPGGLSGSPHPLAKNQHGVRYYEVTGELSGTGHSPIGFEYVYGPIDANGVDQSANSDSPRFGLRGIPFRLIYPAKGWNRHLIVYRPGGDGGTGSGHYLYQSITDEVELVRRGYAYFVTLGGGTTPPDSNPNSSSGLFWRLAPPYWAPASEPQQPAYFRPAQIGTDWSESLIPDSAAGTIWFVDAPAPLPLSSSSSMQDLGIYTQDDVPTFRDHIHVAKNLLQLLSGKRPSQTGMLAWSRSGSLAAGMNLGRTLQTSPSVIAPQGGNPDQFQSLTPRTGGDFETPYEPASGKLVDWFVVRSGLENGTAPQPPDGHPDFTDMLPDRDYPIAAPLIFITGEMDLDYVRPNGYYFANVLAAALPGSKLGDKDINSWLRLYTLPGATHQPHEAWFAGPSNGGGTSYDYLGVGYNASGRGQALPAWSDSLRANNPGLLGDVPFSIDFMGLGGASSVSEEGFELQAIINADRWAKTGTAPPISAVDGNLVTNPSVDTPVVPYPVAATCTPDVVFGDIGGCLPSLTSDSIINDPDAGFGVLGDPFLVDLYRQFGSGPLRYSTEPIDLPGQAVPLGYRLFTPGPVFQRTFTTAELRARYKNHAGYVVRVRDAVAKLVKRGLYDARIGAADVAAAARSPVLK